MTMLFKALHTKPARLLAAAALTACVAGPAVADVVDTLGNASPGFADGDSPSIIAVIGALAGKPAPFDAGIGIDPVAGNNFSASWTFDYTAPLQPIGAASVSIGILDHDSASAGDQVSAFSVDGIDLTALLNGAFNARGGASGEYNVYTIDLPGSTFAELADGSATFSLALTGPVDAPPPILPSIPPGPPDPSNGATLIFSSLSITPVPEPGTFALLGLGALALIAVVRKRSR
jgi:hypothetical protein